mgnify:CR=1 FL=1
MFCSNAIQPHTSVYSGVCCVNTIIPPAQQNSTHDFTAAFPAIATLNRPRCQTDTSGYYTTCATLEGIHAPEAPPAHTRYQRHTGRCTAQHSRPIIIRYIRAQTIPAAAGQLLPSADRWQVLTRCQQYRPGAPAEGSARRGFDASHARRLVVWHRVNYHGGRSGTLHRRGSPAAGGRPGRAARNHWRLPPHIFSGFRPIANRGRQMTTV